MLNIENEKPMIELKELTKYYHDGQNITVGLRKMNLKMYPSEFVAITGESGSGKTTLLNVISGLLPYEEGELFINGEPTSHYDESDWEQYRSQNIGFVFQNYNLIEAYSALENVMVSFLLNGYDMKTSKEKAMEVLEKVDLAERAKNRARQLSSGQRQRLAIARALAKETSIICADEPTGNLDAENGRNIMNLFRELSKDHLIIVVTHNYAEAEEYATRRVVINNGEVVSNNLSSEVYV